MQRKDLLSVARVVNSSHLNMAQVSLCRVFITLEVSDTSPPGPIGMLPLWHPNKMNCLPLKGLYVNEGIY